VYQTDIATTPERLWTALTNGELTRRYWFDRRVESQWTVGATALAALRFRLAAPPDAVYRALRPASRLAVRAA
jgi:uncharacterized protein YndB with AHSA1/START domain